jgi:glycosyltransferase involved in cell wall biosynthesis
MQMAGVRVTGFVPDLEHCYETARCVVAPVQVGAGLQFKVVQAMLHGLPVVATRFAAEGLGPIDSVKEVLGGIEDDAVRFGQRVVSLLANSAEAEAVGARARRWVQAKFPPSEFDQRVSRLYQSLGSGNSN